MGIQITRLGKLGSMLSMGAAGVVIAASLSVPALAQDDNTLRLGLARGVLTFDVQNNGNSGTPLLNIFDTLVRLDKSGNFQPQMAKSFTRKDDTTWEFVLHDNIKFHNGEALTSSDVKFSLERVARDKTLVENSRFAGIEEVQIVDDHTFNIVTKKPDPLLLNRLIRVSAGILPEDYFKEKGVEYFTQNPVGSGPYKVTLFDVDRQLSLQRFDDYFKGRVSDWDGAVIMVLPEAATRVNELLSGGMDFIDQVPASDWPRINQNANTAIVDGKSTRVMSLLVNSNEQFPTSDMRVRQAIDYAIDDATLVDSLFNGYGTPTRTLITPGVLSFDPDLYDTYNYDPAKARQLLEEAGYSDDKPLKLTFQVGRGRYLLGTELAQFVAAMMEEVGIQVELELLEGSRATSIVNNNENKELVLVGYGNSMFDPFLQLNFFNSDPYFPRTGYRNETVDDLLEKAASTMDPDVRADMYRQVQKIAADEQPFILMFNASYFLGINTDRIEFDPPQNEDVLLEAIVKK